jgi:hypothetical protein
MWWLSLGVSVAAVNDPDPNLAADVGVGGAVRANPGSFAAAMTAPAVLALSPRYCIGFGGRVGTSQTRRLDAGAIDSMTGPISLGAVFARESLKRDATVEELPGWLEDNSDILNPQTHNAVAAALAVSWFQRRLAVGIGGRYWQYTSRFVEADQKYQAQVSVAGRLRDGIYLSLSGENLLPMQWDFAQPQLGTAIRLDKKGVASLSVDLVTALKDDPGLSSLSAGTELWVGEFLPLRVGYQRDFAAQEDVISAGIGTGTEQAILEYGANLTLGSLEHVHALSLRFFL